MILQKYLKLMYHLNLIYFHKNLFFFDFFISKMFKQKFIVSEHNIIDVITGEKIYFESKIVDFNYPYILCENGDFFKGEKKIYGDNVAMCRMLMYYAKNDYNYYRYYERFLHDTLAHLEVNMNIVKICQIDPFIRNREDCLILDSNKNMYFTRGYVFSPETFKNVSGTIEDSRGFTRWLIINNTIRTIDFSSSIHTLSSLGDIVHVFGKDENIKVTWTINGTCYVICEKYFYKIKIDKAGIKDRSMSIPKSAFKLSFEGKTSYFSFKNGLIWTSPTSVEGINRNDVIDAYIVAGDGGKCLKCCDGKYYYYDRHGDL